MGEHEHTCAQVWPVCTNIFETHGEALNGSQTWKIRNLVYRIRLEMNWFESLCDQLRYHSIRRSPIDVALVGRKSSLLTGRIMWQNQSEVQEDWLGAGWVKKSRVKKMREKSQTKWKPKIFQHDTKQPTALSPNADSLGVYKGAVISQQLLWLVRHCCRILCMWS